MFRSFMPALTVMVFGVGLGIGISWSQGLIPLTFTPAKSGVLAPEVSQREPLPLPNEPLLAALQQSQGDGISRMDSSSVTAPNDREVFEQQSEPDVDKLKIVPRKSSVDWNRPRKPAIAPETKVASTVDESEFDESSQPMAPPQRVRLRDRNDATSDLRSRMNDAPVPPRGQRVMTTAHQDPTEAENDGREVPREAKKPTSSVQKQLAAIEEKLEAGETLAAHRDLSTLYWNQKDARPQIQELIDKTAKAIFFQATPHFVEPYLIQDGDRLKDVAKKYQLSWEYLAKLNRTDPRRIQIGQKLKVVKGPFGAVVDLKDFALTVHLQGYYVKRYTVGIGKDSSSPIGTFSVINKVENPAYTDPNGKVIPGDDPSNPLGERWIDLGDSYGIHGTIDPDSIGKAASRGCIRMGDKEIIEVYNFLIKGSEVKIRK